MNKYVILGIVFCLAILPLSSAYSYSVGSHDNIKVSSNRQKLDVSGGASSTTSPSASCITLLGSDGEPMDLVTTPVMMNKNAKFDFNKLSKMYKAYQETEIDGQLYRQFVLDGRMCVSVDSSGKAVKPAMSFLDIRQSKMVNEVLPINWWKSS